MAANSPNIYCPLALYRAGAHDGRPYGKALRLYEFAGKNTILKACTARASVASPTVSWAIICPPNSNLPVCLRKPIAELNCGPKPSPLGVAEGKRGRERLEIPLPSALRAATFPKGVA